jgi:hypothetical protein
LQEKNAEKERQLDEVRESLGREQMALSELRRAGAEERQSFTRSLQVSEGGLAGWLSVPWVALGCLWFKNPLGRQVECGTSP